MVVSLRILNFHDFGIPLVPFQRERDGRTLTYWVYTKMPRILPGMERCAFFLYREGDPDPGGTGFFFTRDEGGVIHTYAISNAHVVEDHPHPVIQSTSGKWHPIPIDHDRWQPALSGDDLAAVDITDDLANHCEQFPITTVTEDEIAGLDEIAKFDIGIGEEACMIGLYDDGRKGEFTTLVGRFGCLAALSNPDVLVETLNKKCKPRPAHLLDMRSRDGFSGSPVFVYRTPVSNLKCITEEGDWDLRTLNNLFIRLLGVHYAQFPETVSVKRKGSDDEPEKWEIASSMTTVVPAWEITNLLDRDEFVLQRQQRIAMTKKPRKAVKLEKAAKQKDEPNPNHREDLKRLLSVAVRPPKSSG